MRILLIYPRNPDSFWSFKHVVRFVSRRSAFPPLGLLTVAAMLPPDWELKLVDLNVEDLDERDVRAADFVMISAMIVHKESVHEIAARCAALGRTVIAGGPLFTTDHTSFPEIPHFVLGEAEEVMPDLVKDMRQGTVRACYQAKERPDIRRTPPPRWDLAKLGHYVTMAVQFSRGCPYDCEFCDIVIMNGRTPRTKTPGQLIDELEGLRRTGWEGMVFVVDDNFIGNKSRTRELLHELIAWRKRVRPQFGFLTEASVNLADDRELMELMVEAGFKKVFVGIETSSSASLQECNKTQNRNRDLAASVGILQEAGLEVMGGFIVGFDSDRSDVFTQQYDFIQRSGVVTAMVGLLTALPQTRLYQRLKKEGRIETQSTGNNTEATLNFKPKLNREFLINGYRDLMKRLYEPASYYRRIRVFLKGYNPGGPELRLSRVDFQAFVKSFWLLGVWHSGRRAYWKFMCGTLVRHPGKFRHAMELAIVGHHFRCVAGCL